MQKWINFLLIMLAFVLYGNSIQNDYNIDDDYVVSNNTFVQKGIVGIPEILTHPYAVRGNTVLDYRPVVLISYALEYQFFKDNPHVSHFFNILLYALCLIVIYNFLVTVLKLNTIHEFLPLSIILFFAVHPIHTEVVNSIKNRDELLVLLFGVLFLKYATQFLIENHSSKKTIFLSILFLVLSIFSKIIGVIYFPILVLIALFYKTKPWKKSNYFFLISCFVLIIFVFLKVMAGVKRETYIFENPLIDESNKLVYLATVFKILIYNIKMLIAPFPLRFYYGYNLFPTKAITEPTVLFSIITTLLMLIFGIKLFIKKNIVGLFILCYFVSISLYANFPIPYTGMFSERTLLLGSLWFIGIPFIVGFQFIQQKKLDLSNGIFLKIIVTSIFIFFSIYSVQTIRRNLNWKNHQTLMSHDIESLENSVTANYIYANRLNIESNLTTDTFYSQTLKRSAINYYKQSIKLFPYYADFHYKIASIYQNNFNDIVNAEKYYRNCLRIDSTNFAANYSLGLINFNNKNFTTSNSYFSKAYQKTPTDSLTLFYFAQSADAIGNLELSYKLNKELLDLYPTLTYPYMNLGVYYSKKLKDDTAVIYFEKAIELGERNPQLLNQLAIYYNRKNDNAKAKFFLDLINTK